jgi:hypothetical protein
VGIHLERLKEGCCYVLSYLELVDGDSLDSNKETCDHILECANHVVFIEEKSIWLAFLNQICKDILKTEFSNYINNGNIEYVLFEKIKNIDESNKKKIFAEVCAKILVNSSEKAMNTIRIFSKKSLIDDHKLDNAVCINIYCEAGHPIDGLIKFSLQKFGNDKKEVFIECSRLETFLKKKGCI